MEAYVSTKGQVVIPAELRHKYGIHPGTRVHIVDEGDRIVLQPITREYVRKLRGSLSGGGALKILEDERRREREE
jgi:AbrB family looped-hinge helix DNA binding protein